MGIGELKWNTIGHIIMAVINAGLGFLLGLLWGGIGIVASWAFATAAGNLTVGIAYHIRHKISLGELLPAESKGIVLANLFGLCLAALLYYWFKNSGSSSTLEIFIIIGFLMIIIMPAWLHPMRHRLIGLIKHELI
ncbi:MAG: hypothetical protein M1155_00375 [Patescibacteria group bacterium]|nr:hypothetical protein [Patescibacteria group bacterium]